MDVRARSKAVQKEREKDPHCAFRREQSRRHLLEPSHPEAKVPSVPAQPGPPGLQPGIGAVGKQLWEAMFLTHLLQLQNVSQAPLHGRDSSKFYSDKAFYAQFSGKFSQLHFLSLLAPGNILFAPSRVHLLLRATEPEATGIICLLDQWLINFAQNVKLLRFQKAHKHLL